VSVHLTLYFFYFQGVYL